MSSFRCGRCVGMVEAGQAGPGQPVVCPRCGHRNICPEPPTAVVAPAGTSRRSGFMVAAVACIVAVGAAAWFGWTQLGPEFITRASREKTPSETLQQELLDQNLDKPGDPELDAIYQQIAARHFSGALPAIPVLWEPRLAQVGLLASQAFTLEGMFGHAGSRSVILLNPDLQGDAQALARALCHEMVHAYLYTTGDTGTEHGPAFQIVLQRLSAEQAFEGIMATDAERAALRTWIDGEAARIEATRQTLEALGAAVEAERAALERAIAEASARGALPADEAAALDARRQSYNRMAVDANTRSVTAAAERDHFNREVQRYKLMLVYPDGIDQKPPQG